MAVKRKKSGGQRRGGTKPAVRASGRGDLTAASAVPADVAQEQDGGQGAYLRPYIPLPDPFVASLDGLPGLADARLLVEALDGDPVTSIRFNLFKIAEKPEGRQVPWCRYGFYLDRRPVFTFDPAFHGGAYYVQEASSMFVEHIVRSVMGDGYVRILDLCAAPGGKTTLLSSLAGLESLVVANETVRPRAGQLADNVRRWGLGNVMVTNNDPSHFSEIREFFDIILVDAPCSGEGMFRKNPSARREWSPANVELCAARQRRILADVWPALAPGGVLIYTTCTFNRTENEDNVSWLHERFGCEGVGIDVDPTWGIAAGETEGGVKTFRFYPGLTEGEGFFAAAVRKPDGKRRVKLPRAHREPLSEAPKQAGAAVKRWFSQPEYMQAAYAGENVYGYYARSYADVAALAGILSPLYSGVMAGQLFGNSLRPSHPLALFHDLSAADTSVAELSEEDAIRYLRKDALPASLFEEGLNLVTCGGLPVGWLKRIGERCNNMYPTGLRVLGSPDTL